MLVNAKEMLDKALKGHYAIPQININNLEWTKAALIGAKESHSPLILGASEGASKWMGGYLVVARLVEAMDKTLDIDVPIAIHLDHGTYEGCKGCIDAKFTSIMFDGSKYDINENIEKTKELVALAHKNNISIEAEVGSIGGDEKEGECADPNECRMIADLGIDFLAAGIGNIHGKYPDDWKGLNFDVLAKIKEQIKDLPLVLHGGTGIPKDMIKKSIELGVSKINVNTECQVVFAKATREYIEAKKDLEGKGFDPRKLLKPGYEAIIETVKEKISEFGSEGKA